MIEDVEDTKKTLEATEDPLAADPEAIDALELGLSIPPGCWRKGTTHPNSDGILLRFRPKQSEAKSDGPQRLPQPVFGMVGLVSKSRKQRIKEGLLVRPKMFHDDMGDDRDFVISSDEEDGRNPWGTLAKSWGNIDRSRRPPPPPVDDDLFGPPLPPALPPILRLPPTMPLPPNSILHRVGVRTEHEKHSLHSRLSRRRSRSRSQSKSPSPTPILVKPKSSVHARLDYGKRRRRDEEDSEDSAFSGSESEGDSWTRKSKIPRMRMYADEEESKIKERTKLQARRRLSPSREQKHTSESIDLRNRLGREGSRHATSSRGTTSYSDRHRSDHSDRVVRSERVKSHSRPKPTVRSVASSVWSRLSTDSSRIKKERRDSSDSSGSEDGHSGTSSSSAENLTITRTLRQEESEHDESSVSESDGDSEEESSSETGAHSSKPKGDLRSRLGQKQAPKNGKGKSKSKNSKGVSKPRSPLRIEIDNDEYYRSHQEET